MNDEAFLGVITENPNDSDARQVYADWLEHQGDSRCEIVRLHDHLRRQRPSASAYEEEVASLRAQVKRWLHSDEPHSDEPHSNEPPGKPPPENPDRRAWLDRMGIHTTTLPTDHVAYIDLQRKNPHVVCRFHAPWSGPCVQFRSIYEEVAERLAPWCVFLEANIDENGDWAAQMKISAVPSVMVSKQERLHPLLVGSTTIDKLRDCTEEWLIEQWLITQR